MGKEPSGSSLCIYVCQEENNLENSNPTKTSIACKYKLLLANQYARMINIVNQFLTIEA